MSGYRIAFVSLTLLAWGCIAEAEEWKVQPVSIPTRWSASVSPTNALPEYPRPQLVRAGWQSLNGVWEYAITAPSAAAPARYTGSILVPFPLEAPLSGVQQALGADQLLWYRRVVDLEGQKMGSRRLLHFGAGCDIQLQTAVISGFGSDGSVAMKAGHVPRAACLDFRRRTRMATRSRIWAPSRTASGF